MERRRTTKKIGHCHMLALHILDLFEVEATQELAQAQDSLRRIFLREEIMYDSNIFPTVLHTTVSVIPEEQPG
jgi:hypothetical protein